ncbi:transglycosylase domain-containing protein [Fulvivirga sediminis]|uniref:transglycosylase domain-containing protein n=1 Tax=Fulvivirga sediminis TaxID=2803949 RepID=UPI00293D9223|nr:transglycosylase domain-containing protein [Fulvivirga sediminis]
MGLISVPLLLVLFYYSIKGGVFGELPADHILSKIENNVATEIYSADSVLIGRFYLQERTRTDYDNISPNVINALVATEDARFYEHDGVDNRSLLRVIFKTLLLGDRSSGGGSTITQQLAKNLFPRKDHGFLSMPVTKIKEAITARKLETIYNKKQILAMYLNTVPFGENIYGIEMASKRFFNKKAKYLKPQEAAVIVGMLKANYTYNPRLFPEKSLKRRNVVLYQMLKYNYLDEQQYNSLKKKPLEINYTKITHNTGIATYFREYLRSELEDWCEKNTKPDGSTYNLYTDGLKVYTTINSSIQKYAEAATSSHMKELQQIFNNHWNTGNPWNAQKSLLTAAIHSSHRYKQLKRKGLKEKEIIEQLNKTVPMKLFSWNGDQEVKMSPIDSIKHNLTMLQTGTMAMNPDNGDILAWVGGIDYEYFKYDHVNINTKRQAGSTFKPFVFAAALEAGVDPCDFVSGEKTTYTNHSDWSPGNASADEYNKKYTFKGALAHSVNTVSVKVLEEAGIENTIDLAHRAGVISELPEVPSIALGTAPVSLMEMVSAYCTFANGGYAVKPRYITAITDSRGKVIKRVKEEKSKNRVIKEETSMMISSLLQAVVDEGTGARYRSKYKMTNDFAGKTGTTQSNADGWFIGYNPEIVIGTWVGADNPSIHFNSTGLGSGASMALPIVAKLLDKIQDNKKLRPMGYAKFSPLPDRLARYLDCEAEKEDKQFMQWLFGKKDGQDEENTATFGEEEEEEKKNIFNKIGNIFKKKKKD